jgi:hypothetical protein
VNARSMSPAQSLHARNFSTTHAARPAGESACATVSESGFVAWTWLYAASLRQCRSCSRACASCGPGDSGDGTVT